MQLQTKNSSNKYARVGKKKIAYKNGETKLSLAHLSAPSYEEIIKEIVKKQVEELHLHVGGYELPKLLYKGKGCNICNNTGYRGRLGIYEAFEVTENIRKILVNPQFDLDALRAKADEEGMISMFEDGLRKAELGMTTIEEVLRVIRE